MDQHRYENEDEKNPAAATVETENRPLALILDVEKYEHFFEGEDITPEHKDEYLAAMWSIVVTFISMGVEVLPSSKNSGKPEIGGECRADSAGDVVESKPQNLEDKFDQAAARTHAATERRSRR